MDYAQPLSSKQSPILAAHEAGRRYGSEVALQPVTLAFHSGERVALVGPNGAGKSTLLALLAGALEPSTGTVTGASGVKVGWTPQRPAYYGRLTAGENLVLFARLEGMSDPAAEARRLLEEFELPDDGRASAKLSVGNRQRLNLALSLIGDPDVLLLDEPTAALDPPQRRRLWESAARLHERGGTLVFATQNLEELERTADRVVVLLEGRVEFDGSLAEYERTDVAHALA